MEIVRRGTSEVAEEARLALTLAAADGTRSPAAESIDGHLHDFVAELEAFRMATEMQIGDAVGEWRERSIDRGAGDRAGSSAALADLVLCRSRPAVTSFRRFPLLTAAAFRAAVSTEPGSFSSIG